MAAANSCYQCGGNKVGLDGFCPDCGAMQSSRPSNVVPPSAHKQPPPNMPPPVALPPNYPPNCPPQYPPQYPPASGN